MYPIPSDLLPQNHVYFSSIMFVSGMFCFFPNLEYVTYFYSDDRKELAIAMMSKSKATPASFGPC